MDHVYIIRAGNTRAFKVGVSCDPERRRRQLQTGNAEPLKLMFTSPCVGVNAYHAEHAIHKFLRDKHAHGEWFRLSDDDVVALAATMRRVLEQPAKAQREPKAELITLCRSLPPPPTHVPGAAATPRSGARPKKPEPNVRG